jgi:fructosamine-3-kinase
MQRTPLAALTRRVTEYFRKHAAQYGLDPQSVEARYILNWGGFVNASFFLSDGHKTYHLKLADDEEMQARLARWNSFSSILAEKYRAPRVLDWVKIPRTPFAGLLCESIPGQPASLAVQPRVLQGVLNLLACLHADRELAGALAALDGQPSTCADYFLSVYIDRFDEDLLIVAGDLPPFVPLSLLDWMMGETRELEGLARDMPAFQEPAGSPTHGDLGQGNILVAPDGSFSIIDWDDMALGDPALEYSILLGPLWRDGHLSLAEIERLLPPDPAFRERFSLCRRALVLDQVIDSLADWVESAFAPTHQSELRPAKERVHREALAFYKEL